MSEYSDMKQDGWERGAAETLMSSREMCEQVNNIQSVISKLLDAENRLLTAVGGYQIALQLKAAKEKIAIASNDLAGIALRIG